MKVKLIFYSFTCIHDGNAAKPDGSLTVPYQVPL